MLPTCQSGSNSGEKSCLTSHLEKGRNWFPAEHPRPRPDPRLFRGPPCAERIPSPSGTDRPDPLGRGPGLGLCLTTRGSGRAARDPGFARAHPSRRGGRAGSGSQDPARTPGTRRARPCPPPAGAAALRAGLRVPAPTPPSRASPAAAPAHARGPVKGGERRWPRAPGRGPVRPAEPAWSCGRCRRDRPRSPAAPGRAARAGRPRAERGRGDERRPRGGAPHRRAAPSRSRGASALALRPPPPGLRNLWAVMGRL